MPHGYENRTYSGAGAEDRPDHFLSVLQCREVAPVIPGILVISYQTRLGAAQGREIQNQAQMTGQAETAGMRVSLAVTNDKLGSRAKFSEDANQRRHFSKGEEAGHIGKARLCRYSRLFDRVQGFEIYHDCGSVQIRAEFVIRYVGARRQTRQASRRLERDTATQRLLDLPSPLGCYVP